MQGRHRQRAVAVLGTVIFIALAGLMIHVLLMMVEDAYHGAEWLAQDRVAIRDVTVETPSGLARYDRLSKWADTRLKQRIRDFRLSRADCDQGLVKLYRRLADLPFERPRSRVLARFESGSQLGFDFYPDGRVRVTQSDTHPSDGTTTESFVCRY